MLNRFFGTKIKIVSGYKGGNEIYLAMERGEVDGRCAGLVSSIRSTRPDWFPQHKVSVPIVIAFERMPLFPDAPAIAEFAKDEISRQVLSLLLVPQAMDRPFLAPPGVPGERVAAFAKPSSRRSMIPGSRPRPRAWGLKSQRSRAKSCSPMLNDVYALPADVVKCGPGDEHRPRRGIGYRAVRPI